MKRPLPIYPIEGTDFIVDIDRQELRQADQPDNVISFTRDMTDMGTYYTLEYDRLQKNYPQGTTGPWDVIEVAIPCMTVLDPEGMAEKFGVGIEDLKFKHDFDLFVDPALIAQRQQGALQILWIDGYDFIVDIKRNELRPSDGLSVPIPMRPFNFADDGHRYQAYYHTTERRLVEIDYKMTELPENVVQIRIPNIVFLDPIGVAERFGIDERFLLRRYPLQKEMKAELIALERTHLKCLVQYNWHAQDARQAEALSARQQPKARTRPKL